MLEIYLELNTMSTTQDNVTTVPTGTGTTPEQMPLNGMEWEFTSPAATTVRRLARDNFAASATDISEMLAGTEFELCYEYVSALVAEFWKWRCGDDPDKTYQTTSTKARKLRYLAREMETTDPNAVYVRASDEHGMGTTRDTVRAALVDLRLDPPAVVEGDDPATDSSAPSVDEFELAAAETQILRLESALDDVRESTDVLHHLVAERHLDSDTAFWALVSMVERSTDY